MRIEGAVVRDSKSAQGFPTSSRPDVKAASAPSSLWKRHAWRVTAGTGIIVIALWAFTEPWRLDDDGV